MSPCHLYSKFINLALKLLHDMILIRSPTSHLTTTCLSICAWEHVSTYAGSYHVPAYSREFLNSLDLLIVFLCLIGSWQFFSISCFPDWLSSLLGSFLWSSSGWANNFASLFHSYAFLHCTFYIAFWMYFYILFSLLDYEFFKGKHWAFNSIHKFIFFWYILGTGDTAMNKIIPKEFIP